MLSSNESAQSLECGFMSCPHRIVQGGDNKLNLTAEFGKTNGRKNAT